MSSSIIEQIRASHELSEILEKAVGDVLDEKPNGQKAKIWQQHKIDNLVSKMAITNQELQKLYDDRDGILKEELNVMRGPMMFNTFYEALNSTSEYHQRYPDIIVQANPPLPLDVNVQFSGEEVFGKYLDLHSFYLRFCNLSGIGSHDQDYLQYLDKFNSFFYIPESGKVSKVYKSYLEDLFEYLTNFFTSVQPLVDLEEVMSDWQDAFNEKWTNDKVAGWKQKAQVSKSGPQPLRLGMFNTCDELEALGMDRLKSALEALGLKCGGSLKDRAQRLWSVRGKKQEEFPTKLLAKKPPQGGDEDGSTGIKRKIDNLDDSVFGSDDRRKQTAWTEFKISSLCELIMDIVTATRRHAEKQQSRTVEEKETEILEEEFGLLPDNEEVVEEENEDEGPIYNPLNLPLGWDGKPIPYWLYKLHGLGVEFKCEICGNQSYWGRRNFDKHFQEWRHAHGMRCLGVPNTKHFHDITLIEDVVTLHSKIKDSLKTELFIQDMEEEYEDTEGNVLNRRIYEDLARQGLL